MDAYNEAGHINVGTGEDISIQNLALMIKDIIGFQGNLVNDTSKPDGTPRKVMDIGKIKNLGWQPKIELKQGLSTVYQMKYN